jgi:hypothetical protein
MFLSVIVHSFSLKYNASIFEGTSSSESDVDLCVIIRKLLVSKDDGNQNGYTGDLIQYRAFIL